MSRRLVAFLQDESGATSIEYSVVASGVLLAIVTVVSRLGTSVHSLYLSVSTALK
jgi:pilus assembly protein Flp/PilA